MRSFVVDLLFCKNGLYHFDTVRVSHVLLNSKIDIGQNPDSASAVEAKTVKTKIMTQFHKKWL